MRNESLIAIGFRDNQPDAVRNESSWPDHTGRWENSWPDHTGRWENSWPDRTRCESFRPYHTGRCGIHGQTTQGDVRVNIHLPWRMVGHTYLGRWSHLSWQFGSLTLADRHAHLPCRMVSHTWRAPTTCVGHTYLGESSATHTLANRRSHVPSESSATRT